MLSYKRAELVNSREEEITDLKGLLQLNSALGQINYCAISCFILSSECNTFTH